MVDLQAEVFESHGASLLAQARAAVWMTMDAVGIIHSDAEGSWWEQLRDKLESRELRFTLRGVDRRELAVVAWWLDHELDLDEDAEERVYRIELLEGDWDTSIFDTLHFDELHADPSVRALWQAWSSLPAVLDELEGDRRLGIGWSVGAREDEREQRDRSRRRFAEPQKLKLGIFGLTKVGKSTLFNSIVGFPVSPEDVDICTGTTLKATRDVTAPNSSYVVHFLRKSGKGGMEDLIQGIRDEIGDVQQDLDGDGALEEMPGFQRNKAGATQESRRVALGKTSDPPRS